ncbi:MAG: hypothetical protein HQM09_19405 [Candidatus Riflebacteria bacterium]|nr:hypothetical protein [Candidatus Riflebacteria bacterium]
MNTIAPAVVLSPAHDGLPVLGGIARFDSIPGTSRKQRSHDLCRSFISDLLTAGVTLRLATGNETSTPLHIAASE